MKIYEIGTGYTPIPARIGAATEIVVEELTRAILENGLDATIIDIAATDRLPTDLPLIEVNVPKRFQVTDETLGIVHKLKRAIYSISLASRLKKIIQDNGNVVFHFHNQYNLFFFLKLTPKRIRQKCRITYTNHSYVWHGEWNEIEPIVKKRYFQEISSMKSADNVYVLNQKAHDNIVKHIGIEEDKIRLIDNGVNIRTYSPLSEKDQNKEKLNLDNKIVFVQVGSVCDRKNQLGALELLAPLMMENPDIIYCYAGGIIDAEYKQRIDNYAADKGLSERVQYFGELKPGKELNEFYNLGDAMLFPSKAEGFSLVILEAMAAGVPVVINKNLEFKLSSACIRYGNETEFVNEIQEKILNEEIRNQLSLKSRIIIEEEYSWEAIAREYAMDWKD